MKLFLPPTDVAEAGAVEIPILFQHDSDIFLPFRDKCGGVQLNGIGSFGI